MKKIFMFLIAMCAIIISCTSEKRIKTITITECKAKEAFGEVVADSTEFLIRRCYEYDNKGQIVRQIREEKVYGTNEKDTLDYEQNVITPEQQYDEKGNIIKLVFDDVTNLYSYDDNQRLLEIKRYNSDTLQEVDKFKYNGDTIVCRTYNSDGSEQLHVRVSVKCGKAENLINGEYLSRYGVKIKYNAEWKNGVPVKTENAITAIEPESFIIYESGYMSGKEYSEYKFDETGEWKQKIDYCELLNELTPISIAFREIEYY